MLLIKPLLDIIMAEQCNLKLNFEHRYIIFGSSGARRKVAYAAGQIVHLDGFFRRCETCRKVCRGLKVELGLEVSADGVGKCSKDRAYDEECSIPWAPHAAQMFVDGGWENTAATLAGFSHQENNEVY